MRQGNGFAAQHFNFFHGISYQENKTLTQIANEYELDKGDCLKNNLSWNNIQDHFTLGYANIYHRYMEPYRNIPVEIFEVGIADGRFMFNSIKMWLSYFMRPKIHCVDNFWGVENIETVRERINSLSKLNVNFYYGDQDKEETWNLIYSTLQNKSIDFFIEDGSHNSKHMMYTLYKSIDLVKKGGIYFMEDIQDPIETSGKFGYNNIDVFFTMNNFHNNNIFQTNHLSQHECETIKNSYKIVKHYDSSEKPIKEGLKMHMFVLEKIV